MWRDRSMAGARGLWMAMLSSWVGGPAMAWPPMCVWQVERDQPAEGVAVEAPGLAEVFAFVRVDRERRVVEFDGEVAIHAHAPDGSVVFLEAIACRPDTKEHESLVVTRAMASHVHAALLLVGGEPGQPGGWRWEGRDLVEVEPEGSGVAVTVAWIDESGSEVEVAATDLVMSRGDGRTFTEFVGNGEGQHVFAGSRFVDRGAGEVYDADGAGVVVGLHTFGSEVVALQRVLSHEASVLEPEWIARRDVLPARGTAVVVRLRVLVEE